VFSSSTIVHVSRQGDKVVLIDWYSFLGVHSGIYLSNLSYLIALRYLLSCENYGGSNFVSVKCYCLSTVALGCILYFN
jgi:hypothetical protein